MSSKSSDSAASSSSSPSVQQMRMYCGGCHTLLSYPSTASLVQCAVCRVTNRVPTQQSSSSSSSSSDPLSSPSSPPPPQSGSIRVRCPFCSSVLSVPVGSLHVCCGRCHQIFQVPPEASGQMIAPKTVVVIQNPPTLDAHGNLKPSLGVGVSEGSYIPTSPSPVSPPPSSSSSATPYPSHPLFPYKNNASESELPSSFLAPVSPPSVQQPLHPIAVQDMRENPGSFDRRNSSIPMMSASVGSSEPGSSSSHQKKQEQEKSNDYEDDNVPVFMRSYTRADDYRSEESSLLYPASSSSSSSSPHDEFAPKQPKHPFSK